MSLPLVIDLVLVKIYGLVSIGHLRHHAIVTRGHHLPYLVAEVVAVGVSFEIVAVTPAASVHEPAAFFCFLIIVPPQVVGSARPSLFLEAADVSGVLVVESAFRSGSLAQGLFHQLNFAIDVGLLLRRDHVEPRADFKTFP